jgi:DNA mismatch repair protein MutS2
VFQSVEAEREALAREREALMRDRVALERVRGQAEEEARRLDAERHAFLERAQEEVAALVRRGRRELDALLAELRERPSQDATQRARLHLRELTRASEAYAAQGRPSPEGGPPEDLRPGEAVFVVSLNQRGTVQTIPDARGEVELQVGALKLRVPLADLRRLPTAEVRPLDVRPLPQPPHGAPGLEKALAVSSTLDLRGFRAEDAIEALDKYLDDSTLAGLARVTVVHGKGTGALRQVVREHLSRHPEVASFRLGADAEGGSGATIVELARR